MQVRIFSTAAEQILAHAARDHPHEACGLLLGQGSTIETAIEAANIAVDPDRAFDIDPVTLLRVHREAREGGRALLGWYHSHPNGCAEPSAIDAMRAEEDGRFWLIAAAGKLRCFEAGSGSLHGRFAERSLVVVPAFAGMTAKSE